MAAVETTASRKRLPFEVWACVGLSVLAVITLISGIQDGDRSDIAFAGFGLLFFGGGAVILSRAELGKASRVGKAFRQSQRAQGPASSVRAVKARTQVAPERLSEADRQALEQAIEVLSRAGMFKPEVPVAAQLEAAAADFGPPVGLDLALTSVFDTAYYDESFLLERYAGNLRFQPSKLEQTSETIGLQMSDLVELSNGALDVRDLAIEFAPDASGLVTVTCMLNDEPFEVSYLGSHKYLSTVLFQQIALRYEQMGLPARFAAFWVDAGTYLTVLERGSVEELNGEFVESDPNWQLVWADEESFAHEAGDIWEI